MNNPNTTWGNASSWGSALGYNQTPAVGSVAWWNSSFDGGDGHVAYVEKVSSDGSQVFVTADNYVPAGGYTDAGWIATSSVSGFLHPDDQSATAPSGDANNGWFQMVGSNLDFIQTKNTTNGHVVIHTLSFASGYQTVTSTSTTFSTDDANNGWFQMVGSTLWFIKTKNTTNGQIVIHSTGPDSNYQTATSYSTPLSTTDANSGWFQMDGSNLWFIKTKNTTNGQVVVHELSPLNYYQTATSTSTALSSNDADNGWFQIVNSTLWFIKTKNTTNNQVVIHSLSPLNGYQSATSTSTVFSSADANNGWFQMDGSSTLWFIKTKNTTNDQVVVHSTGTDSRYQTATSYSTALAG